MPKDGKKGWGTERRAEKDTRERERVAQYEENDKGKGEREWEKERWKEVKNGSECGERISKMAKIGTKGGKTAFSVLKIGLS